MSEADILNQTIREKIANLNGQVAKLFKILSGNEDFNEDYLTFKQFYEQTDALIQQQGSKDLDEYCSEIIRLFRYVIKSFMKKIEPIISIANTEIDVLIKKYNINYEFAYKNELFPENANIMNQFSNGDTQLSQIIYEIRNKIEDVQNMADLMNLLVDYEFHYGIYERVFNVYCCLNSFDESYQQIYDQKIIHPPSYSIYQYPEINDSKVKLPLLSQDLLASLCNAFDNQKSELEKLTEEKKKIESDIEKYRKKLEDKNTKTREKSVELTTLISKYKSITIDEETKIMYQNRFDQAKDEYMHKADLQNQLDFLTRQYLPNTTESFINGLQKMKNIFNDDTRQSSAQIKNENQISNTEDALQLTHQMFENAIYNIK